MAALTLQQEEILCEKVKQYPALFDEQLKGYRKKDVWPCMECSSERNRIC